MQEKKNYTCKNERVFKEIFRKEENKDLLISLLESCLNVKIHELKYLKEEKNNNYRIERKSNIVRLSTDDGTIQVDITTHYDDYSREMQLAFLCDDYTQVWDETEISGEHIIVTQINLVYGLSNFVLEEEFANEEGFSIFELKDEEGIYYVDNFKIYEFDMDHFMKWWRENNKEKIDQYKYLMMLDFNLEDLEKIEKKDKIIEKYKKELDRVNKDSKLIEYISNQEKERTKKK